MFVVPSLLILLFRVLSILLFLLRILILLHLFSLDMLLSVLVILLLFLMLFMLLLHIMSELLILLLEICDIMHCLVELLGHILNHSILFLHLVLSPMELCRLVLKSLFHAARVVMLVRLFLLDVLFEHTPSSLLRPDGLTALIAPISIFRAKCHEVFNEVLCYAILARLLGLVQVT